MIPITKLSGRLGNQMFQYAYLYSQMRMGRIPDVYVQNYEYFDMYSDEIKKLFGEDIEKNNYVAIHVRRGDYVDNPFYVDLMKTDYYERAMAEFPDAKFKVFSDDVEWCAMQPIFKDCEFSENINELEDLNEIAGAKGIIMANSSFSWWGAYLSNAIVISPKLWYSDNIERTKLLSNWKVI